MATMRAVLLTGHGDVDRLELRDDVPLPTVGPGDVLVRVGAAAVNNTDINTRVGWYSGGGWTGSFHFPRIQGIDLCGTVVEVGQDAPPELLHRRVLVEPCWRAPGAPLSSAVFLGSEVDGAFAEFCVVPARHAYPVDSTLTDVELATFPCSASTALNLVSRARVTAGERVLVTGASGGVGSAAVQLAAARGALVTGVASTDKHEAVHRLGAVTVLARNETPAAGSFDAVIDVVGGATWPRLLEGLRPGGRYAVSGAVGGAEVPLDLRTLYLHDLTLIGATVLDDGVFAALVRHIEAGEVHPVVDSVYPLDRIVEAQQRFAERRHVGKIVLTVARGV